MTPAYYAQTAPLGDLVSIEPVEFDLYGTTTFVPDPVKIRRGLEQNCREYIIASAAIHIVTEIAEERLSQPGRQQDQPVTLPRRPRPVKTPSVVLLTEKFHEPHASPPYFEEYTIYLNEVRLKGFATAPDVAECYYADRTHLAAETFARRVADALGVPLIRAYTKENTL